MSALNGSLTRRSMLAGGFAALGASAIGSLGPAAISVLDHRTGSGDWSQTFQAAIDAANPTNGRHGGGLVYVPAGDYPVRGGIRVHTGVSVVGDGWGSQVRLTSGSNQPIFTIDETTGADGRPAFATVVASLRLNGNGKKQSGDAPAIRIATGSATTPIFRDHRHTISDLFVQYCRGDGLVVDGTRASRIDNVYVTKCTGAGVRVVDASDGLLTRIVSAGNGTGFVIAGASNNLLACRASRNTDDGFRVTSSRAAITNGYSLDNGRDGYRIEGHDANLTGCVADSNRQAGLRLVTGSRAAITGLSSFSRVRTDSGSSPFVQSHGVLFESTRANAVTGVVRQNRVNIGGSNRDGLTQVVAIDEVAG